MPEIGARYSVTPKELEETVEKNLSNPIAILEKWFCKEDENPDFFNYLSELKNGAISDWDRGMAFDSSAEIRWEREQHTFHVVWIKDNGDITGEGWDKERLSTPKLRELLLWGEKVAGKNEWYEKQAPRVFKYPAPSSGSRVYLEVAEYILENGSTVFRYKGVKTK